MAWWSASRRGRRTSEARKISWISTPASEPLQVRLDTILFEELADDLRTHYAASGRVKHLDDAERRLRHVERYFRGWPVVKITPATLTDSVVQRKAERVPIRRGGKLVDGKVVDAKLEDGPRTISAATINRELALMRRLLSLGRDNGSSCACSRSVTCPGGDDRPMRRRGAAGRKC